MKFPTARVQRGSSGPARCASTGNSLGHLLLLADVFSILLEDNEVVPVYDFLVFLRAELSLNLCCFESFDPRQGFGGEVYESFGELFAGLVEAAHRISCIKGAADVHNA